uniref:Uncharacterized protein n=1 Tax=Anguilla anguilla TaxID=7936 RepID=A0A0E9U196_ANGAN
MLQFCYVKHCVCIIYINST